MTTNWRPAAIAVSVILVGQPVAAQSVSDILTFLVTNQGVQTGSVERDRAAAQATSTTISRALLANLATLPVASSSGGFVYRLNPELGTPERVSQSFGPFFVERAQTAGKGQVSFGLTMQQLRFSSLDGRSLRDGSLITTANQFNDETAPFDVDRLTLDIDASMATLYANAGIADRIDVGVALPMVSLSIDGSRVNTYRGREFTQATAHARSTGFADVILRTKFVAYRDEGASVGGAVDVRLPTGRSEDLLGTGTSSVKLAAIGSLEHGRVSSHANAGVTVGGLAREVSYAGALAVAATGHVTVIGELIGRLIEGAGGVTAVSAQHPTLRGVETIRLVPSGSTLNSIAVAPGVKWNITDTWVLAANVTVPLTNDGLTTRFTPFVGLDYAIGR
jgi:Putative MetA-pathway of phenol degradation